MSVLDKFTSPAGVLTLLLTSGWSHRRMLLKRLEASRYDGLDSLLRTRGPEEEPSPELRFVSRTLKRWLDNHPGGPLDPGQPTTDAIVAMVCGWSCALSHALAREPRTIEELEREVNSLGGEKMVREHLKALVDTGQAEILEGEGDEEPRFVLSLWGREALAPLVAAARHEAYFPAEDVMSPEILDAEAAFQVMAPLLRLPRHLRGTCRLGVRVTHDGDDVVAGATAEVADGRVRSTSILLEQNPSTWATGAVLEWCEAVIDPSGDHRPDVGGDTELAAALLAALHERLFGEEA